LKSTNEFLVNLIQNYATAENFHLIIMKIYTEESFVYRVLNENLRNKRVEEEMKHMFPYYFLLHHSMFM
jgi:hypothetical protein